MYLIIENNGMVEVEAFTLLGASTKREDSTKIGMFGSGNKYALAYFMREGYSLEIYSGEEKIVIGTVKKRFREKEFQVITVNGQHTSITTETGPQWDLWQSIREFYSNAIDEGGEKLHLSTSDMICGGKEGMTRVIISSNNKTQENALKEFWTNIDNYFKGEAPFLTRGENGNEILQGTDAVIFHKGIRAVRNGSKKSLFHYNLNDQEISEERLFRWEYEARMAIWRLIIESEEEYVINRFCRLIKDKDLYEHNDDLRHFSEKSKPLLSNAWRERLKGLKVAPFGRAGKLADYSEVEVFPDYFYEFLVEVLGEEVDALMEKRSKKGNFLEVEPTAEEIREVSYVEEWLNASGYTIDYPIKVMNPTKSYIHGLAKDGTIYISKNAFLKGRHWLASIIIEEQTHLKTEQKDETRGFQDALIDELLMVLGRVNNQKL